MTGAVEKSLELNREEEKEEAEKSIEGTMAREVATEAIEVTR